MIIERRPPRRQGRQGGKRGNGKRGWRIDGRRGRIARGAQRHPPSSIHCLLSSCLGVLGALAVAFAVSDPMNCTYPIALGVVVLIPALARAQADPRMALDPWPTPETWGETHDDILY